jgi:signal transduction histidine kinase
VRRIDEVHKVAQAFEEAAAMLRERQRALNEALAGERQAREEAEGASRSKDEFLAMLGHELRNPLNAITSAVGVLDRVRPEAPQALRARAIIARQIVSLRELVDDLLDVARVTRGKITLNRRPMDLCAVVKRVLTALGESGRLTHHHLELDCHEAWILGDETRIEQVVNNLIDNAAKYTPSGGRIIVRVRRDGESAMLQVEDTGVGITRELLPRVFELFTQGERTLERAQGGLGLGLTLVRRLVELHGGSVEAASTGGGHGSCFTVRIPLAERAEKEVPLPVPESAPGRALRILVVEDNADGRETLMSMLGIQGHHVEGAATGPLGLERALAMLPDVAVVDIGLPGFDGYELARRLRASAHGTAMKLIALTGYGQEEDRRLAGEAGFDAFLVKPANLQALMAILATA